MNVFFCNNGKTYKYADKGGKYMNSKGLDYFALVVTIIGAINWGLIGFFKFDLVAFLFGQMSWISRIVYAVFGLCGLYLISLFGRVLSLGEK